MSCRWPPGGRWRSGLLLWRERLNDDQSPATARTGDCERAELVIGAPGEIVIAMICIWRSDPEELPDRGDIGRTVAVPEEAVVANAMLTSWKHMHQEPANELSRCQRHRGVPSGAFDAVIFYAEGDATLVHTDQAAVGDRNAVRISR